MNTPFFTISIDLELMWGMRDTLSIQKYGNNILGGRKAIPLILDLFNKHNVKATWAVVGLITFSEKDELLEYLPKVLPDYKNLNLNPYSYINEIGPNEKKDPYHYGYSLVKLIQDEKNMEIASHTFSHFYSTQNRNSAAFDEDLISQKKAFSRLGLKPKSIVFCRNLFNKDNLISCKNHGLKNFRGNENHFIYEYTIANRNIIKRGLRYIDSHINLSGNHLSVPYKNSLGMVNVPSSRFLRPHDSSYLNKLRLKRILESMTIAAKNESGYHLWWHPHNFGKNVFYNMKNLETIIYHYKKLRDNYGLASMTMKQIGEEFN